MNWIAENLWIAGVVIIAAVGLQALWIAADTLRRTSHHHRQRQREADLLSLRIAAATKQRAEQQRRSLTWDGWRKFEVKRKVVEDGEAQVCSFYLAPHDDKPIPGFEPGQFLTLQLHVPGQERPVVRCYSLSDAPRPDHYRLSIKRVLPPRNNPDAPPGVCSNHMHDRVNEGDILDVRAPSGQFFLDIESTDPVVLIGAGVGVTPMLAMLNAIAESGSTRETWFFYGVRHSREHIQRERLETIAAEHPNIRLHVCYSDPLQGDPVDQDRVLSGRVNIDMLKRALPSNNYKFYVCGPPPMMDALLPALEEWGVPSADIHTEAFGPAARKKDRSAPAPKAGDGPVVRFRRTGKEAPWAADAEHLWEFATANEVRIDSGCLEGNCGSCQTAILAGKVKYTKDPGFKCEDGTCLVCCCVPEGPLELDA